MTGVHAPPARAETVPTDGPAHAPDNRFRDVLRRLPKAELHCHLDGSLRPLTLLELSAQQGHALPVDSAEKLARWMRVDDARHLEDYLARFEVTLAVMQDRSSLVRIARELVEDAAADGVRYIEVRFCPALNMRGGLAADEVMESVLAGLAEGERLSGTVARVIVCALRSFAPPHAESMAEVAVAFRHRGVVGFDLAGGELGNPAGAHAAAFDYVRRHDVAVTVHAGEGDGPSSIRDALVSCGAARIGHGTRLFEDASLETFVVDRQIPLEMCPTSNVQTRVVASLGAHPLARYVRRGAVVSINTDNRLMSGVSLTDEYWHCAGALGLDLASLAKIALAGFDSAFIDLHSRRRLRHAALETIVTLLDSTLENEVA